MHGLDCSYEDSVWTRKRDGVELPQTTNEAIKRLGGSHLWADWGGARLSHDRTYYVLPSGRPLLKSTIRRVMGSSETEHRLLASYLAIPNGQVKNFLNACRAVIGIGEVAYVAVVGSKASEGGGIWHRYFALWLALRSKHVIIDFYDFNEKPDEWQTEVAGTRISCEWIPEGVDSKTLKALGYNAVIDDVWTYEMGSGMQEFPDVPFFSQKCKDIGNGAVPFLHAQECRRFSHPSVNSKLMGCSCLVCSACKDCSETFDEYMYLRNMCSRLGFGAPCVGISFSQELNAVNEVRVNLLTLGGHEITHPSHYRQIMSLTEELALSVRGKFVRIIEGQPEYKAYRRFDGVRGRFELQSYPWLRGKSVLFCGVPSTIIGATEIRPVRGPQSPDLCDVVFFNSIASWKVQFAAKVVYVPSNPEVVVREVPDWSHTGNRILQYYEYVREERVNEDDRKMHVGQVWKGKVYPQVQLFPFLDSSYLDCPLVNFVKNLAEGALFSVVKDRWKMKVVPFSMRYWRTSVIVYEDKWTLVKFQLYRLYAIVNQEDKKGFRGASVFLPWDMSRGEVERFEQQYFPLQRGLRDAFESGQSFPGKLPQQKEFNVDLTGSSPMLIRQSRAHPVTFSGWELSEWERMRLDWGNLVEFEVLEQIFQE